jgi:pimeloyl-ACP methyl ester carboxylesterase
MLSSGALAQQVCERIMEQDQSQNNLKDPAGYVTGQLGELGSVTKRGTGPQTMLLIPGLGFGSDVFTEFMVPRESEFTMFAVTLPGFAGTSAPPSPPESTSFAEQIWTNGALTALENLINNEGLGDIIVVGHWLTGTQLALRLALKYPEKIRGVVIISGSPTFMPTDTTQYPARPALEMRVASIDQYMAPKWFKTVTRETWDDNNFLPIDYAINPVRGLRLWRMAAEPPLHVWVRYLCEFYAQDICGELDSLKVPTLLMKPGLEGIYHDPGNNYMRAYCRTAWDVLLPENPRIESTTLADSRICMWFDQPQAFDSILGTFIRKLEAD